jgi:hypothetical protein
MTARAQRTYGNPRLQGKESWLIHDIIPNVVGLKRELCCAPLWTGKHGQGSTDGAARAMKFEWCPTGAVIQSKMAMES